MQDGYLPVVTKVECSSQSHLADEKRVLSAKEGSKTHIEAQIVPLSSSPAVKRKDDNIRRAQDANMEPQVGQKHENT